MSKTQTVRTSTAERGSAKQSRRSVTPSHKKALGKNAKLAGTMRRWMAEGRIVRPERAQKVAQAAAARAVMKAKRQWIADNSAEAALVRNAIDTATIRAEKAEAQLMQARNTEAHMQNTVAALHRQIEILEDRVEEASQREAGAIRTVADAVARIESLSDEDIAAITRLAQMLSAVIVRIAPDIPEPERLLASGDINRTFRVVNSLRDLKQFSNTVSNA